MSSHLRWLDKFKAEAINKMILSDEIDHEAFIYSAGRIESFYTKAKYELAETNRIMIKSDIVCAFEDICENFISFAIQRSILNAKK